MSQPLPLVLASTSPYRQQLLRRLQVPFTTFSPQIDESALPGEAPEALVRRLAEHKARAAISAYPKALLIGSDQVAVIDGQILGKPHTHERAKQQLRSASGRQVNFVTALCLLNSANGNLQCAVECYGVQFRSLSEAQIEAYLRKEPSYHCAGSFQSEGLGIALLEQMIGPDPNTLIGLPMIRLVHMLEAENFPILS